MIRRWNTLINVLRSARGEYIKGEFKDSETQKMVICANVQPFDYRQLIREPQGRRIRDAIRIYSEEKLIPQNDGIAADRVEYLGNVYEVYQVKAYLNTSLRHFKSIALLMNAEDQLEDRNDSSRE